MRTRLFIFTDYRTVVLLALFMAGSIFIQGCTVAIVGAGEQAYSHLRGDFMGIVPEPLEKVHRASVKAISDLDGYDMADQNINILDGHITAYDPQARKVQIKLKKTEHNQTEVSIRIGAVGNKIESVYIYDRIQYYLKEKPVVQNVF